MVCRISLSTHWTSRATARSGPLAHRTCPRPSSPLGSTPSGLPARCTVIARSGDQGRTWSITPLSDANLERWFDTRAVSLSIRGTENWLLDGNGDVYHRGCANRDKVAAVESNGRIVATHGGDLAWVLSNDHLYRVTGRDKTLLRSMSKSRDAERYFQVCDDEKRGWLRDGDSWYSFDGSSFQPESSTALPACVPGCSDQDLTVDPRLSACSTDGYAWSLTKGYSADAGQHWSALMCDKDCTDAKALLLQRLREVTGNASVDEPLLVALLTSGRVIPFFDGVSERNQATQDAIATLLAETPVALAVVTSRRGAGVPVVADVEITPEPIDKERGLTFWTSYRASLQSLKPPVPPGEILPDEELAKLSARLMGMKGTKLTPRVVDAAVEVSGADAHAGWIEERPAQDGSRRVCEVH